MSESSIPLLKHHCSLFHLWWSLTSSVVCSTGWLVCCKSTPLRLVPLCFSLLPVDDFWYLSLACPQLCSCSPRWDGSSWWLEKVETVRCGKLVAGGCMLASMLPIWCPSLQGFRSRGEEGEKQSREESVRVHERLAWWHLCHSALSRTSFSSLSHSTLSVVLLSIPSLSLFPRLCCLFAPSSSPLTLWFDPFTLLQQAHLQTLSTVTSLFYSLYPILYLHLYCFHPIISPFFFFNSKLAVHLSHGIQDMMHLREHNEGQRETSDWWMCLRQV